MSNQSLLYPVRFPGVHLAERLPAGCYFFREKTSIIIPTTEPNNAAEYITRTAVSKYSEGLMREGL